jgi:hypothetical protein
MNIVEILKLAAESGAATGSPDLRSIENLRRFFSKAYAAGADAERRACELACADVADQEREADPIEGFFWAEECIAAIRARGEP